MGLPRRFLNLIMDRRTPGWKVLRCIDLERQKIFNTTKPSGSESQVADAAIRKNRKNVNSDAAFKKIPKIRLPRPIIQFRASPQESLWSIQCIPLAGHRVLCLDHSGSTLLFNLNTKLVMESPDLHKPMSSPISISIPSANGESIYVMESYPLRESVVRDKLSYQFEKIVYCKPPLASVPSLHRQLLPPPPFVRDPKYKPVNPIVSYAVVDGGSHICISTKGAGTYCLDTAKHIWSKVGEWTLPFQGKVEYVPELKLWFGISDKGVLAAAADLSSTMNSQPQLLGSWKELEPPQEWKEMQEPVLANLGSGRFCILRFFHTWIQDGIFLDHFTDRFFTVLTGADVVPTNAHDCNGKVELEMIKHNSRLHISYGSDGNIRSVF